MWIYFLRRMFLIILVVASIFAYFLINNVGFIKHRVRRKAEIYQEFLSINHRCMKDFNFHILNHHSTITKDHPIQFFPNLRNPCWFEYYNETDLINLMNSPYLNLKAERHVYSRLLQLRNALGRRLRSSAKYHNIRLRCLPHFIIIGQAKCGTTDLFQRLRQHPQIEMGMLKEPDWWTRSVTGMGGKFVQRTQITFEKFVDLNGLAALNIENQLALNHCYNKNNSKIDTSIIGEGSIATLSDQSWKTRASVFGQKFENRNNTAQYLRWILPDSKIIIILRDPANRLFSEYLFFDKAGLASQGDFHKRVVDTITKFNTCKEKYGDRFCVDDKNALKSFTVGIHRGLYSVFIKDWLVTFPSQNILVLKTEEYAENEMKVLTTLFKFLNLDPLGSDQEEFVMNFGVRNKNRKNIGEMSNDTRKLLEEFYRPYNKELSSLLKDNRFLWF